MRKLTFFLGFCTTLTAILGAPSIGTKVDKNDWSVDFHHNAGKNLAVYNDQEIRNTIILRRLSNLQTSNYFEDLISAVLNMSAKELLENIDDTFKSLDRATKETVRELNAILNLASPELQAKLIQLRDKSIADVFRVIGGFLEDLGLVLPVLTGNRPNGSVADIIYALLRKTLEEFVRGIANAMEHSLRLLDETMNAFKEIAQDAPQNVKPALERISDTYWTQGRLILVPMVDKLRSLLDYNKITPFSIQKHENKVQSQDLLADAVSSIMGIDIETAALETKVALLQLVALVETTRDELYEAVSITDDVEVRMKVMEIYDNAMVDIVRDVKPISDTLLQFQGNARQDKSFTFSLASSLLGIGTESFKIYLRNASSRVEAKLKVASTEILTTSVKGGVNTALKTWGVVLTGVKSGKSICEPLLELLKPLLVDSVELNNQNQNERDWSEEDGEAYNRDALILSVSKILGFDVASASQKLKTSLENLDNLMEASLEQLESILSKEKEDLYNLKMEILGILIHSLTDIHIAVQPMLDIMLPFLPDGIRSNKEIALDIYSAINEVSARGFTEYCRSVVKRIPQITDSAAVEIKTVAAKGGSNVQESIETLLMSIDALTKTYISPFLDVLKPIMVPRLT